MFNSYLSLVNERSAYAICLQYGHGRGKGTASGKLGRTYSKGKGSNEVNDVDTGKAKSEESYNAVTFDLKAVREMH